MPTTGGQALGYGPALDGLRAVAVALVIAEHAWPGVVLGGWVGVDLFFVLSGFLITTLLIEEHGRHGRVWLSGFFQRRLLRLLPGMAALLIGYWICWALVAPALLDPLEAFVPLVYVTNVLAAFGLGDAGPLLHLWSLATEEQFYLVWPVLLVGALHRGVSHRTIVVATAGAAASSAVWCVVLWAQGAGWERLYFGPDTRATPLLVGALLGQLWVWTTPPTRHVRAIGALSVVAIAAFVPFVDQIDRRWYGGGLSILAVACAGTIFATLQVPAASRLLSAAPLVRAGTYSYPLYLWHPLTLWVAHHHFDHWAAVVGAVAASYPVAALTTRLVEQPILRLKERLRRPAGCERPLDVSPAPTAPGSAPQAIVTPLLAEGTA